MKQSTRLYWLIGILFVLAACKPATPKVAATVAPTITPTHAPTSSPMAIQSLTPTRRSTNTRQPTQTAAPTSTPSPTLTLLATNIFPILVAYPSIQQTSTPIAIPKNSYDAFRLKNWQETDAIDLLNALDKYIESNDLCFPAGCVRDQFVSFQKPVEWALQEALWRFPETTNAEQYEWRLALAHAIQGDYASDEWMLATLERWLNDKALPPDLLDGLVSPYGFAVVSPLTWWSEQTNTFDNLFGDQEEVRIYRLTTQGSLSDGILFTIHADDQGKQKIVPIFSNWDFNFADDYIVDVADHNQNGISEILLYIGRHSGTLCDGKVFVLEWQNGEFMQRIDGEIKVNDCISDWGYGETDENGIEMLYVHNLYTYYTEYFQWDGHFYRFANRQPDPQPSIDIVFELQNLAKASQYAESIALIQSVLPSSKNWSPDYAGPSIPDFLRFQLGLFYMLQGNPDRAKAEFQSVANSPANPSVMAVPQAAQAFLENYEHDENIYLACKASLEIMQKALAAQKNANQEVDNDQTLQAWGYNSYWPPLCNLDLILPHLTAQFTNEQASDIPTWLRQSGVTVEHSFRADLDGDGDPDWLEVVSKPPIGIDSDATVWVFLQEPWGISSIQVNRAAYEDIDLQSAKDTFSVTVSAAPTSSQPPIIFVRSGKRLLVFQVFHADRNVPSIGRLVSLYQEVTNFSLTDNPNELKFTISYLSDKNDLVTENYRWDHENSRFKLEVEALEILAEQAAQAMLRGDKASTSIPALQAIVAYPLKPCDETYPIYCDQLLSERSRYHYLLALAYELSGDEAAAVQTYWQLWHDFPHSPYALMARAKLKER